MAHSNSAKKRIRQNEKRRQRNRWRLRTMRGAIKKFRYHVTHDELDQARDALKECQKVIDRTAQKGVIHRNQASRRLKRLNAMLKAKTQAG